VADTESPFPEGSLVLLVGPPAAGKTTFAARLVNAGVIEPEDVLSSDELRRVLTGSEADTSGDVVFDATDIAIEP